MIELGTGMEAATDGTTLVCTWGRPKPIPSQSEANGNKYQKQISNQINQNPNIPDFTQ